MPDTPAAGDLVRTLISVTRAQHDWLRTRAFERRTSITAEIRELVQREMGATPVASEALVMARKPRGTGMSKQPAAAADTLPLRTSDPKSSPPRRR